MKALLVEDNVADVTLFRLAVESLLAPLDLSVADDGVQALDRLRRRALGGGAHRPDFILLDLNLPRKGGLEVLGELKSDPLLRGIPVIVLTSSRGPEEIARAYDLQAAAYFVKPLFGFESVVQAIVGFMGTAQLPADRGRGSPDGALPAGPATESSSDATIMLDASGFIMMVNQECTRPSDDRRDGSAVPGTLRPVSADAALDEALACLRPIIRESGVEIVRSDLPTVRADHDTLVELFENLLGNALKFCAGGRTRIEIGARRAGSEWVVSVADNGIGIDHKYFDRVFHLFQRLHQRDAHPGTGLGLGVCERLVESLGGRIWVESSPGAGAAYFFTLPASPGAPPDQPPSGEAA